MADIRVLIADDHPAVAESVRALLDGEFDVIGVVPDGEALVAAVRAQTPDVIVSDIAMPRRNGLEAAEEILRQNSRARIVLLTAYADPGLADVCLSTGILGYVLKSRAADELPQAIREAFADRRYVSTAMPGRGRCLVSTGSSGRRAA